MLAKKNKQRQAGLIYLKDSKSFVVVAARCYIKIKLESLVVVVVHTFDPSIRKTEAGGSMSSRPAWWTEQVTGWLELHKETLPHPTPQKKRKEKD